LPKPQPDQTPLARFQDRLLELLAAGKTPEAVRAELLADPSLEEFHPYVEAMEPHMLDVAAELVKKWGTRGKPS
jgi:hypothetical protein